MDAFFDLSWRLWPSIAFVLAGAVLVINGALIERRWLDLRAKDVRKPAAFVGGLRLLLLGVSLMAVGAGWQFQIAWLFWLGLIFGGEETLETSFALYALRRSERAIAAYHAKRTPPATASSSQPEQRTSAASP